MRWLKRIGIVFAALALVLTVALWWLLGTGSGMHFVLDRVVAATDGAVTVKQARGSFAGPLTVENLHYTDGQGTDVKVNRASVDIAIWPLLGKTVHLDKFSATGVTVQLPGSTPEEPEGSSGFSLEPPLGIVIDEAQVDDLDVRQGAQSLFAAKRIELAGGWTRDGILVKKLLLRAPDGHADAHGQLLLGTRYHGDGQLDFSWTHDARHFAGTLKTHGDGSKAQATLTLMQPMTATVHLQLEQRKDYPWQLDVKLPRGDATPLLGDGDIKILAADLHASGTQQGGQIGGIVRLNDWPLSIKSLQLALSPDRKTVHIQSLDLASGRVPGSLQAQGKVELDANPVAAQIDVSWKDVKLPVELAGQELDSHGQLEAHGSIEDYQATGEIHVGPPGRLADLKLDIKGNDKQLDIRSLDLKQPRGSARIAGTVTFQPSLRWDVQAEGKQFDPGQLLAGWDGALDFNLTSQGQQKKALDAVVTIKQLDGRLRQRKISGQGQLHLSADRVVDGKLNVAMGESHVTVEADPGKHNDVHLNLVIASLGDWLPDAAGSVHGEVRLRGNLDSLALTAKVTGKDLRWQQQKAGSLDLDADVPNLASPGGRIEVETQQVEVAGLTFDTLNLDANGTEAHHSATVTADGRQVKLKLALGGQMPGKTWQGTLTTLNVEPKGIPGWRLVKAVPLSISQGGFDMDELCLTAGDPRICLRAKQDKRGELQANYQIKAMPLTLVSSLIPDQSLPISVDGKLDGQGTIERSSAGVLSGHAEVHSDQGSVTWLDSPQQPLLGWTGLHVDVDLKDSNQTFEVHSKLSHQGTLDGRLAISGANQQLDGHLEFNLDSLAFAELLSQDLANVQGALNGQFKIAGTLAEPALSGQARVSDFAAEVPMAGLKLTQGQFQVSTQDAQTINLDGSVRSGQGQLKIGGHLALGDSGDTAITIKGDQFMAADIPAAKLTVSPDLVLKQDQAGLNLAGSVKIDRANVDVSKLPGAGATQASPDVVVMDAPEKEASSAAPLTANITIDLGNDTHLKGFGLNGSLRGQLAVRQRPGRAPIGQGQIQVDGTYHAYGQDLQIERGQLLFASTPLGNPGLNIRAARKLNPNATIDSAQEVGLQISGTATRPVLTVFSNPTMPQSDALSYLVTGKPLSEVKGGEGNLVSSAAQALGSATGDLLAKSVGSKLGVDDIGVSSNQALGGSAAFTVGKYLSPRLYLNYGVGLFDPGTVITLRYLLNTRWNFEATQATDFSRASFNYRYEK